MQLDKPFKVMPTLLMGAHTRLGTEPPVFGSICKNPISCSQYQDVPVPLTNFLNLSTTFQRLLTNRFKMIDFKNLVTSSFVKVHNPMSKTIFSSLVNLLNFIV